MARASRSPKNRARADAALVRRRRRDTVRFAARMFTTWGLINLVLAWRIIEPIGLPGPWRAAAWIGSLGLAAAVPYALVRQRRLHAPGWLLYAAYLWASFASMAIPLVVLREAAALGVWWRVDDPATRALAGRTLSLAAGVGAAILALIGWLEARRPPRITRLDLSVRGLAPDLDGFRIVQITDLHTGGAVGVKRVSRIVRVVNALAPDLLAVTGDLADGSVDHLAAAFAPVGELRARRGKFFVTGNHEYYWDLEGWLRQYARVGLTILHNDHRVVRVGRARLLVAGVPDPTGAEFRRDHRPDPAAARRGAGRADFALLLAHQPRLFGAAARARYDLVLSGHTHGGQLWPWSMVVHRFHERPAGLYRLGRSTLYVCRGVNWWGPPNRLGVPTEIVQVTLRRTTGPRPWSPVPAGDILRPT